MNSTTPITIAIPGEKRNGQQVKQFLLEQKLIQENDMNQELIYSSKVNASFVQMRAVDALSRTGNGIDLAITGLDQMREYVKGKERFDEGYLTGFSQVSKEFPGKAESTYDIPFFLDNGTPTKIQLLVPSQKQEQKMDLADDFVEGILLGKIRVLTPYPVLASKILKIKTKIPVFPVDLIEVGGKTEVMIRAGFGDFGIDVVDSGESAKRNGLTPTEVLYESYPAAMVSSSQLEQDKKLQQVVQILTEASNNAYYNSSRYRQQYPRG